MTRKVTKPRQAGSARTLDRWQREVEEIIAIVRVWGSRDLMVRLRRLLASIRKAERR